MCRRAALHSALFTSYGTDYHFLSELVKPSPAAARPRGVTVVDNYDHHRQQPGLDERTYTPANTSVGVYFSVVMPPFFAADAATADRTRVHHGTMHPKMWLLEYDEGGPAGSGFLRLVISSANLGRYDAKINNQQWACDFCRVVDAPKAIASLPRAAMKQELLEHGISLQQLAGCEIGDWRAELLEARRASSIGFAADLLRFVFALLGSSAPELWEQWQETLGRYELTPPVGTHLIFSVPGRYSVRNRLGNEVLGYALSSGSPPSTRLICMVSVPCAATCDPSASGLLACGRP